MSKNRIAIVAARRTPIGAFQGSLASLTSPQLGGSVLKACLKDAYLNPSDIKELLMGCVLQAGLGQNPARQAGYGADFLHENEATTINKVCGSGMKTIMLAHDLIQSDPHKIVAAGGMESMTNAPYLLSKARAGQRFGHGQLIDGMLHDGLEDAYHPGCSMGSYAEKTAEKFGFTREIQDKYAISTTEKAIKAIKEGSFKKEIISVTTKAGDIIEDETPFKVKIEKIPTLKSAFKEGGTVTAASSSSISDGAAALILMSEKEAYTRDLPILAFIVGHFTHAQEPEWFTLAPIQAIHHLLKKISWDIKDIDLFEINEAFAVVALAAIQELKLDPIKVNIHGGGCALGHPIGASGSRIVATLLYALEKYNLKKGIASLCIGGGEATALAIERPS